MSGSDDRTVRLWSLELSTLVLIGRHNDRIVDCRCRGAMPVPSLARHVAPSCGHQCARRQP